MKIASNTKRLSNQTKKRERRDEKKRKKMVAESRDEVISAKGETCTSTVELLTDLWQEKPNREERGKIDDFAVRPSQQ